MMTKKEKEKYYAIIEYNLGKCTMTSTVSKGSVLLEGDDAIKFIEESIKYDIERLRTIINSDEVR